jgi:hypothetical protein
VCKFIRYWTEKQAYNVGSVIQIMVKALNRAEKYGENAANACVQMIKVKEQFMMYNDKRYSKFN